VCCEFAILFGHVHPDEPERLRRPDTFVAATTKEGELTFPAGDHVLGRGSALGTVPQGDNVGECASDRGDTGAGLH
jgi:hypothetical protein